LAARGGLGGRVPSVWMARDDVALDERVPGHALVGPPGAGKRALLGQLARRFPGRGVNVDNFHGGGAPDPRYRARPETSYAALSPGLVCAWSAAHRLEPALVEYAVEMAQDTGARFHLVIAATPARWAELVARAPALAALRVIELAAPRDDELLARWICQRPQLEDRVGARLDLAWSLAQLDRLATIAAPAELLRVWLRELGLTSRALYEPGALTRHGLEPALPGARVPRRRLAASRARARLLRGRPWLEPLIPDDAQLDALRELDAAISGDGLRRW
ncbi:MAG: hypothetical protein KC468_21270, partial [Myxococcales bacterium]|nr:hypothetical protein [Myxococcales bacterium]